MVKDDDNPRSDPSREGSAADYQAVREHSTASSSIVKQAYEDEEDAKAFPEGTDANQGNIESDFSFIVKPPARWIMFITMIALLITGTYDSVAFKWMNLQYLPRCGDETNPDCSPKYFEGAFTQTLVMYIGELLCLAVYYIDIFILKKTRKGHEVGGRTIGTFDCPSNAKSFSKKLCPFYWWAIPTLMDYSSSTMINYAFILTFASTVQVLGSFSVLLTALLSLVYLRTALTVHNYAGIVVVTVGIILTTVYSVQHPEDDSNFDSSKSWIGILLSLVAYVISSFQFVFEEGLFRKYYCSPMLGVGTEGVFGTVLGIVLMVIGQYTGFENVKACCWQFAHSRNLQIAIITCFFSVLVFNATGLIVTKVSSGLLRAVLFALRACLVWLFEMILGWNGFDGLDFGGLILVSLGVLLYNNVFPYWGCPGFKKVMQRPIYFWCVKPPGEEEDEDQKEEPDVEAGGNGSMRVDTAKLESSSSSSSSSSSH